MDKPPPEGSSSLRTMVDCLPEVEDIKRTTSAHQNKEQIAVKKLREHLDFDISSMGHPNTTYLFANIVLHC